MQRGEKMAYMLATDPKRLFAIKEPAFELPDKAAIYESAKCSSCGETTAEPWLRVRKNAFLCLDCVRNEMTAAEK